MKIKNIIPALLTAGLLASGLTACMTAKESQADLLAQAKITETQARQIAIAKVPGATIKEGELEKEHGKLIWSFDMTTPGSMNTTEVNVNAITGAVISVEQETPKQAAKEKGEDAKEEKK